MDLGSLGECCLWRSWVFAFRVTLGKQWESCKNYLHYGGHIFLFGWILRSSWGLGGIRGRSLVGISFFFDNPLLLGLLKRFVRRRKDLGRAGFPKFFHLRGGINLRTSRAWCTDNRRVVYTFYPSKCRRGLNLSLVKGLIPHLEVVVSTYSHDLSPGGFLSFHYPHIIAILFGLVPCLLGIL